MPLEWTGFVVEAGTGAMQAQELRAETCSVL